MVDQDKSHLHGRHVSENPLTPTASSLPPHLSQTPFYSQVTYSTEKKGKKMEYEHIQKPTHIIFIYFFPKTVHRPLILLLKLSTQPGGCAFLWWTRDKYN